MMFTIEDAKRVQRDLGLGDRHVAYVEKEGFVLAHTDAERASGMDLRDCEIHDWLTGRWLLDELPGWYEITGMHQVTGIAL